MTYVFTWDFLRLLPYIFIGYQPPRKKTAGIVTESGKRGDGFSFSGARISLLLSHISGFFFDRNRGPFHGLSQIRGVVATNEMKNTIIY